MKRFYLLALNSWALATSSLASEDDGTAFEELSVQQLCEMRGDSDAVAELERRELFSNRELRAIKKQKARYGIRLEALICAVGLPDRITRTWPPRAAGRQVDLYSYFRPGRSDLHLTIKHDESGSIVVSARILESRNLSHAYAGAMAIPDDSWWASEDLGVYIPE